MKLSFAPRIVRKSLFSALILGCLGTGAAFAATTLPTVTGNNNTTLTATVSEQVTVSIGTTAAFAVTNIGATTPATAPVVVSASNIVLDPTKSLLISVSANAAAFTPSAGGTTWDASAVSWAAASSAPTAAVAASGTLSNTAATFVPVAECTADVAACSVSPLFLLAAKPTITLPGSHSLVVSWKFESID